MAEGYASAFRNEDRARDTVLDPLWGHTWSRIVEDRVVIEQPLPNLIAADSPVITEVTLGEPLPVLASLVVFKSATSERDPAGDAENPHLSPGRKA